MILRRIRCYRLLTTVSQSPEPNSVERLDTVTDPDYVITESKTFDLRGNEMFANFYAISRTF